LPSVTKYMRAREKERWRRYVQRSRRVVTMLRREEARYALLCAKIYFCALLCVVHARYVTRVYARIHLPPCRHSCEYALCYSAPHAALPLFNRRYSTALTRLYHARRTRHAPARCYQHYSYQMPPRHKRLPRRPIRCHYRYAILIIRRCFDTRLLLRAKMIDVITRVCAR